MTTHPAPRAPLALAAAAFAAGIWLAGHLDRPAWLWGGATALPVLCSVAAVFKNNLRLAQISAVFAGCRLTYSDIEVAAQRID